jgi:hypothetical protein
MPTVKDGVGDVVKEVTVRQTPLMAMESPRWASESKGEVGGRVMVREVPPVESEGLSSATAGRGVSLVVRG